MAREKNNELRQKILFTAYHLFLEQGYDSVSTKEIAQTCGITPSLLQHYFPKKEVLLFHIVYNIITCVKQYIYKRFSNEYEKDPKLYYPLSFSLFYHLFYSVLARNNDKLLVLYSHVLYNTNLIKSGNDYTLDNPFILPDYSADSFPKSIRTRMSYVASGCLSQFIPSYLDGSTPDSLEELVALAVDLALYAGDIRPKDRKQVHSLTTQLLTNEIKSECYQAVVESTDEFVPCSWL